MFLVSVGAASDFVRRQWKPLGPPNYSQFQQIFSRADVSFAPSITYPDDCALVSLMIPFTGLTLQNLAGTAG